MNISELFYYIWRIVKWKLGNKSPILASIKLTFKCNLLCKHCGWREIKKHPKLSLNDWKNVLGKMYKLGIRIVVFEGGEPTLIPFLDELIIYAKNLRLKTILVTNGTNELIEYSPDLVLVSVDGPREIHNKIRGKNSFELMLKNVSKYTGNKICLTTVNQLNYQYLNKFIDQTDAYFDSFTFNIMYSLNNLNDSMHLNQKEIDEVYNTIQELSSKYNIVNTPKMLKYQNWKCAYWLILLVEPNGYVNKNIKCFMDYFSEETNCENCELICYKGISFLADADINSWYLINKYLFR